MKIRVKENRDRYIAAISRSDYFTERALRWGEQMRTIASDRRKRQVVTIHRKLMAKCERLMDIPASGRSLKPNGEFR